MISSPGGSLRKIILIPIDGDAESSMYASLVNGGFDLGKLESSLFVKLYELIVEQHGRARISVWGVSRGDRSVDANKWNSINQGDLVLFCKDSEFVSSAVSRIKFQSENIARLLWSDVLESETRQYLFTLEDISPLDLSTVRSLNAVQRRSKLDLTKFQIVEDLSSLEILRILGFEARESSATESRAGFGLGAAENKVIERHSVELAIEYLNKLGYADVQDVGDRESYDLLATSPSGVLHVEVKGSTGPATSVILTKNEVDFQRSAYPENALLIVSEIDLEKSDSLSAKGGTISLISPWLIEISSLVPISYKYTVQ